MPALPFEYLYPDIFKNERAKKSLALFFGATADAEQNPFFSHTVRWENTSRSKVFFSNELRQAIGNYNVYEDLKSLLPDDFMQRDCLSKAQYLEMILFLKQLSAFVAGRSRRHGPFTGDSRAFSGSPFN